MSKIIAKVNGNTDEITIDIEADEIWIEIEGEDVEFEGEA